jgi:di/tricarboxylate transporter
MLAGSADFSTPIGYQCNLMVYAPGGYKFRDYIIFGGPLQILTGIVTIAVASSLRYWWIWTVALALANVVVYVAFEGLLPGFTKLFKKKNEKSGSEV